MPVLRASTTLSHAPNQNRVPPASPVYAATYKLTLSLLDGRKRYQPFRTQPTTADTIRDIALVDMLPSSACFRGWGNERGFPTCCHEVVAMPCCVPFSTMSTGINQQQSTPRTLTSSALKYAVLPVNHNPDNWSWRTSNITCVEPLMPLMVCKMKLDTALSFDQVKPQVKAAERTLRLDWSC